MMFNQQSFAGFSPDSTSMVNVDQERPIDEPPTNY